MQTRSLAIPLLLISLGTLSAFFIAPQIALQKLSQKYDKFEQNHWYNFSRTCQWAISHIEDTEIRTLAENFEKIQKNYKEAINLKEEALQEKSWGKATQSEKMLKALQKQINKTQKEYKKLFRIIEEFTQKIALWEKEANNLSETFFLLQSQIEQYEGKVKAYLLTKKQAYDNNYQFLQDNLKQISQPQQVLPKKWQIHELETIISKIESAISSCQNEIRQLEQWLNDLPHISTITAKQLSEYNGKIQSLRNEIESLSTNNQILNKNAALRKADSLLLLAENTYQRAFQYFSEKDYIETYNLLDELNSYTTSASQELNTQKISYQKFQKEFDKINKELSELQQHNPSDPYYQQALAAYQMALHHAMMSNWVLAYMQLQQSSSNSETAYQRTFRRLSPYRQTYIPEHPTPKEGNRNEAYKPSKHKSDSRAWGSYTERRKPHNNSSSGFRRSDSRSWGRKRR